MDYGFISERVIKCGILNETKKKTNGNNDILSSFLSVSVFYHNEKKATKTRPFSAFQKKILLEVEVK